MIQKYGMTYKHFRNVITALLDDPAAFAHQTIGEIFRCHGEDVLKALDIPPIDPIAWADDNDLHIIDTNVGPKIICYKAVHRVPRKTPALDDPYRYIAEHGSVCEYEYVTGVFANGQHYPKQICRVIDGFEYFVGTVASVDKFDSNPLVECSYGLHGTTAHEALKFGFGFQDPAILTLEVDPKDCVVPYDFDYQLGSDNVVFTPSWKLRFSKCFVLRAEPRDTFAERIWNETIDRHFEINY